MQPQHPLSQIHPSYGKLATILPSVLERLATLLSVCLSLEQGTKWQAVHSCSLYRFLLNISRSFYATQSHLEEKLTVSVQSLLESVHIEQVILRLCL